MGEGGRGTGDDDWPTKTEQTKDAEEEEDEGMREEVVDAAGWKRERAGGRRHAYDVPN